MYPKNLQYHQKIIFLSNSKKLRQWIGPLTFTTRSTNGKAVATVTAAKVLNSMGTVNFVWGGGTEPMGDKTFSGYLQRYFHNINDLMWLKWAWYSDTS